MRLEIEPKPAPPVNEENILAGWYKPTVGQERPYLVQPAGYPDLPRRVLENLGPVCDHCGQMIRRQQFYLFRHLPTGGWAQVSAGCLPDFIGETTALRITSWTAAYDQFAALVRDGIPTLGREHWTVTEVVETAIKVIKLRGWVSRGRAHETGETATASDVLDLLEGSSAHATMLAQEIADAPDRDDAAVWVEAERALEWLENLHAREIVGADLLTDYLHNLATVASMDFVEARSVGLLCSAPGAYESWKRHEAERAAHPSAAPVDPGKHFGTIDERVECDVHVNDVEEKGENEYGLKLLVSMTVVPTGEKLSWWTGEGLKLEKGRNYHVRLTPKTHGQWDGYNVTTVNRVMEYVPPEPKEKKPRTKKGA